MSLTSLQSLQSQPSQCSFTIVVVNIYELSKLDVQLINQNSYYLIYTAKHSQDHPFPVY